MSLLSWLTTPRLILRRGQDQLAYLTRWGIRTRYLSIFIHRFEGPDPGDHLHDHPWGFVSFILRGGYDELRAPVESATLRARVAAGGRWNLLPGSPMSYRFPFNAINVMPLSTAHTITYAIPGTLTLVICGRKRDGKGWGFYTEDGYVPHGDYEHPDRSLVAEYPRGLSDSERSEYEGPTPPRSIP